jgi:ssDNA-binding Zn-finger/Zn-ribbon topoisomerase 1
MMFFFIAGIHPKTIIIDSNPVKCPTCGLYKANLKRTDHYLSVFFLPIFRIKKGNPILECQRCGKFDLKAEKTDQSSSTLFCYNCPYCGEAIGRRYRFCPFCGRPL